MAEENKGIYFTELTLKNVRCFGDEAVLKLSNDKGEWSRWNVILGDNGTGKTTLLQCLAGMEQTLLAPQGHIENVDLTEKEWVSKFFLKKISFKPFFQEKPPKIKNDTDDTQIQAGVTNFSNSKKIHVGYLQKRFQNFINASYTQTDESFANIFIIGYGATRRISFQILSEKELETEISATLFDDDAKLINTEEWLLQIEFAASRDSEIREIAIRRSDLIKNALKNILPDVEEIRFRDSINIEKPVPRLEFRTPYGWVGIKELSFGYKTMVAWIVDVAARMFNRYPNSDNPLEEPVIVLVDEIDLHLHPKWQRQIFDFLEKRFPKAQFIVTAHSPLIVQSAPKDANIIVLKKEQVGDEFVVKIDNSTKSVWSWRIDQIMASDLFGLEGLRNPEIEKQMDERTRLLQRDKNSLTDEEKARLDELNELAYSLPTAESKEDIEAMEIIRKAAKYLLEQKEKNGQDK